MTQLPRCKLTPTLVVQMSVASRTRSKAASAGAGAGVTSGSSAGAGVTTISSAGDAKETKPVPKAAEKTKATTQAAKDDDDEGGEIVIRPSDRMHCEVPKCRSKATVRVYRCEGCNKQLCATCAEGDGVHGFCRGCDSRVEDEGGKVDEDARTIICWPGGTCSCYNGGETVVGSWCACVCRS
jgi:hypothetical protein